MGGVVPVPGRRQLDARCSIEVQRGNGSILVAVVGFSGVSDWFYMY